VRRSGQNKTKKRYVIVGNGVAGVMAAETIRSIDPKGQINIISDESVHFYSRCFLPHYIQGLLPKEGLSLRNPLSYQEQRIILNLAERILGMDLKRQLLVSRTGKRWHYDLLLLAMGAKPISIKGPHSHSNRILTLRTLKDADNILKTLRDVKRILIVGGGMIGTKLTHAFQQLGFSCHLLVQSDRLLSQSLDKEASSIYKNLFGKVGVPISCHVKIKEILVWPKTGKILGVMTEEGEKIQGDLIVICKGVMPDLDLFANTSLETKRGICVNNRMATNFPNVFAAGDVAEKGEFFQQASSLIAIWPEAAEQGCVAGANMAGKNSLFIGSIPRNTFNLFNLPCISAGIFDASKEGDHFDSIEYKKGVLYIKLVFRDECLVGFILIGNIIHNAGLLLASIREKVPLRNIKDYLLDIILQGDIEPPKHETFL